MKTAVFISPSPGLWPALTVLSSGEAEVVSVDDWIERILQAWSGSAGQTLELARLVHRARRSLPYGSWSRLWQSGQVPFSKRKGEMLVVIGKCVEGMGAQTSAHLPAAWNTLHYLARLGRPAVERLIQEGRIHAGLTLREAKALLAELHPGRRAKTPRSNLAARLRRFSAWVRTERKKWSLKEQTLVRRRLLSLAEETGTPAKITPLRAIKPSAEKSCVDSVRLNSISML